MWGVRFPPELRTRLDDFARSEDVSRAEAIRRLVERGLDA